MTAADRPFRSFPTGPAAALALTALASLSACGAPEDAMPQGGAGAPPPTNRIAVPQQVRDNLNIRFQTVERRRVAATLRLPGQFELLPAAQREHRAMLAGLVEVHVELLQRVKPGQLLATLDAPEWRARQREIADLDNAIELANARREALDPVLTAHARHERSIEVAIGVLQERIRELEATRRDVGGQAKAIADANVALAQLEASAAEVAEQHAATQTRIIELESARTSNATRRELALAAAGTLLGVPAPELENDWWAVPRIEIRARTAGIVDRITATDGRFVQTGDLLLVVTDPTRLRFRAHAPQSDLGRLTAGSPARIAPAGAGIANGAPIEGELALGIDVDRSTRMVELFLPADPAPAWARPGMAAFLEVETDSSAEARIAVPRRAVQRDGLKRVLFRRDTRDPDQVIRVEAELGVDDGEWVVVKTELTDGDEVVVEGAYELMLESSTSTPKGGHFHADGTWHADDSGDH